MSEITARAEATRARLVNAAVTAFAEKGFHATTTRDIAAAAGMSPAALYVHHKSKEELLHLITLDGHETTLAVIRDGVAASDDPAQQLRKVVNDFAIHHARDHTRARVINYELSALSPDHAREIREFRQTIAREFRAIVDAGVEAGQFSTTQPHMATVALVSLGIDIARWYRDEGEWTPEDIGTYYSQLALRIVGAPA